VAGHLEPDAVTQQGQLREWPRRLVAGKRGPLVRRGPLFGVECVAALGPYMFRMEGPGRGMNCLYTYFEVERPCGPWE
jgi:hypothetical protein